MLLIGRDLSPFVRRCATLFNLLELAYERKPVATEVDGDFIRQHNPLGRVPALLLTSAISEGAAPQTEVIVDSMAIIDYALEIADNSDTLLTRQGAPRRRTLYVSAIATGVMEKAVSSAYEIRMRPDEYVYEPYLQRLRGQLLAGLVELNSRLDGPYYGGEKPSLADVNAVIAYDQVQIVAPKTLAEADLSALAGLSDRANELQAFSETRWRPES